MAQTTLCLEFVNFSDRIVAGADSRGIFDEFLKNATLQSSDTDVSGFQSIGETVYFIDWS